MRKHRLFIALAVFLMLSIFCYAFIACGNGSPNNSVPPIIAPSEPSTTDDPDKIPTPQPPSETETPSETPPTSDPETPPTTEPEAPPVVDPPPTEPPIVDPETPPTTEPETPPVVDPTPTEPPTVDPETPPTTEPETPPVVDPTPPEKEPETAQNPLSESIDKTLWTDGNLRYRFNADGSVDILTLQVDGAISITAAEFVWNYENDLLYFVSSETTELVEIISEPTEAIKSSLLSENIERTDGIIIDGYFVSERNLYTRASILFENGAALIGENYSAFADELAETPVSASTETVYVYPSDIHEVVISFSESSMGEITLHNYLGDNYITSHELSLPTVEDENFIGWQYGETVYVSVCEIMFDLSDNEKIELVAAYKQPEEPEPPESVDPIVGTYVYVSKTGETTHTVIFDSDNMMTIYESGSGELIKTLSWTKSSTEENTYLPECDDGALVLTEDGITVNSKTIKKLLTGKTIGSCVLTKKETE